MAEGRTVVDSSDLGLGRDVWGLKKIADDVGINIVSGTGYYVDRAHPWYVDSKSEDDLAAGMIRDISEGADGTDIRCGLIGEIGTSDPITENEWKVLRAGRDHPARHGCGNTDSRSARAKAHARHLGSAHRGDGRAPHQGYRRPHGSDHRRPRLHEADCGIRHVLRVSTPSGTRAPPTGYTSPTRDRIGAVEWLISEGHEDQLLFSHDIGLKARLASFGGPAMTTS